MNEPSANFPAITPPSRINAVLGLSRSTALRLEADPATDFPVRRQLSGGRTGWVTSELIDWARHRPPVRLGRRP